MTARERAPYQRLATQLSTSYSEAACDHCLDELPLFVSDELAGRPVDDVYPAVADHLDVCADCLQEYVALSQLLRQVFAGDGGRE